MRTMHTDPVLLQFLIASALLLALGSIMRIVGQPHVVSYLLCGMGFGPYGLDLIGDIGQLERFGELGVMMLLFFVGMKIHPRKLLANWRRTILLTIAQIAVSVALVAIVGLLLDWPAPRVILIGFVLSLSSTAVVLSYLEDRDETDSDIGRDVIGVLLAQDLALVPMLIIISLMGGQEMSGEQLLLQLSGVVLILLFLVWLTQAQRIRLPLGARLRHDHEMQLFAALVLFLGMAVLADFFRLSAAMGAFLAGMLVASARETAWVGDRLDSFRTIFVALFFVSIGSLVDLQFIAEHRALIVSLLLLILIANFAIKCLTFRLLGEPWSHSITAGAMLAQIGEFSFVLVAAGLAVGAIGTFAYSLTVIIIAMSLLLSPAMIGLARWFASPRIGHPV